MLPERKKTPEEIAALRGKLGVPAVVPLEEREEPLPRLGTKPLSEPTPKPEPNPKPVLDPDSGLPVRRHTPGEIQHIQRQLMIEAQQIHSNRGMTMRERPWVIVLGYLFTMSILVPIYHELAIGLPMAMLAGAGSFAVFIFLKRPYSKHHGAFIGMIILFVLTYAMVTYFPPLRNAT